MCVSLSASYLEFIKLFGCLCSYLVSNLGNFQPLFIQIFSLPHFLSFCTFAIPTIHVLVKFMESYRFFGFAHFSSIFSFCSLDLIITIVLSSNLLLFYSAWLNSFKIPLIFFSFALLYVSAPEFLCVSFLIFYLFYWHFILSIHCFLDFLHLFSSLNIFKQVFKNHCLVDLLWGLSSGIVFVLFVLFFVWVGHNFCFYVWFMTFLFEIEDLNLQCGYLLKLDYPLSPGFAVYYCYFLLL